MSKNLYIDMDGVLANLQPKLDIHGFGAMYKKNFFYELEPMFDKKYLKMVFEELQKRDYKIHILSIAVKSKYCKEEKMKWLEKYAPKIDEIIIGYTGDSKADLVGGKPNGILFDDYTKNLEDWANAGGTPVKVGNTNKPQFGYIKNIEQLLEVLQTSTEKRPGLPPLASTGCGDLDVITSKIYF